VVNQGDTELWRAWWQDPGFRTSAFYSSFGQSLVSPWFSAFHSFADGIYSTLWGDGLVSGMADRKLEPPWNYDLMGAGYWISLGVSLLLLIGAALVLARLIRQIRAEWFLILGMVLVFGFGLLWNTLQAPYYCTVKAFYAFPALLPFSALVVVSWDWLRQRQRILGVVVWVLLLVWSMTVYTAFWVRSGNPQTQLLRGTELGSARMAQGKLDEAIQQYEQALRLNPDHPLARYNLGNALQAKGQTDEAIRQYQEALRLKPDYAMARNNLGNALARKGQLDEAISQLQEAIRLAPQEADGYYNLGNALARKGQVDLAIRLYEEAIRLKPDDADVHSNLGVALYRKGRNEEAIGQFLEALKLRPNYADARRNLDIVLATKARSSSPPSASTNR
jgi:Tfp pilus assembly protein PilF